MAIPFEIASGSIAGRDHRIGVPKNRQDDYCVMRGPGLLTAIIADGCGSGGLAGRDNPSVKAGGSSEIGASVGVRLLSVILHRLLTCGNEPTEPLLRRAQRDLEAELRVLAIAMGSSLGEVVDRYLLFTLLGCIITEKTAMFFGLGDGLVMVNGAAVGRDILTPIEGNQPTYLGYALTGSTVTDGRPDLLDMHILDERPAAELDHFLLGTDGVHDFIRHAGHRLPGLDQTVGPLEQFWTDDRYYRNPAAVERRLNLAARDWHRIGPSGQAVLEGGLLHDDTTVVVGRYIPTLTEPNSWKEP